jgi:NAD(P)-dependent dehydrogenase (short-subunit alcohol dehydrogenase family)
MGRLEGKVALITGSASGIGRESAVLFAGEGAKVVVADYAATEGQETVKLIEEAGGTAIFAEVDVSKASDIERMIGAATNAFGKLDILFNNAGTHGARHGFTADLTEEEWDRVMDINLKSIFRAAKVAIPVMLNQGGGVIINTASAQGIGGAITGGAYCTSKAGIIMLTKVLAIEYGRSNIRVNCICPGVIETPMSSGYIPILKTEALAAGRPGQPNEVAHAALFLASDESSYIHGAVIPVDGGWTAEVNLPLKRSKPAT